jgi:acyl carrier protein
MSATQSPAERELAELIVNALNLEGVAPADIDPQAPLFKTGLGLDSIDALELALEISKRYGLQLRSDDENNVRIFSSLRALSEHIAQHRVSLAHRQGLEQLVSRHPGEVSCSAHAPGPPCCSFVPWSS